MLAARILSFSRQSRGSSRMRHWLQAKYCLREARYGLAACNQVGAARNTGFICTIQNRRWFSSHEQGKLTDPEEYEKLSEETLEELSEYLENCFQDIDKDELDININSGVMKISLGQELGTYVINKQSPNKQIWLSSPTSGPKRYDFIDGQWIYSHDGSNMHDLLERELTNALQYKFNLKSLHHYRCV